MQQLRHSLFMFALLMFALLVEGGVGAELTEKQRLAGKVAVRGAVLLQAGVSSEKVAAVHPHAILTDSQQQQGQQAHKEEHEAQLGQEEKHVQSQGDKSVNAVLLSRICAMCATLYGCIAILWLLNWPAMRAPGSTGPGRFQVFLLCLSWCSTSVGMHVLNKCLVGILEAPALISAVQMGIAAGAMGFAAVRSLPDVPKGQIARWMVVPTFFAAMLTTSFYAYELISLTLLTVVRNLTPLVVLPIEAAMMPVDKRPVVSAHSMAAILIMLMGALVYGGGNMTSVSFVGIGYAVLNMVVAASDRLIQRRLLTEECKDMPSSLCTTINNLLGLLPTMALAAATHQVQDASVHRGSWTDPRVLALLIASGLVGIGICYLGFECQRVISATSFFVMQNVSKVAVVSAGAIFFADPIKSSSSILGLSLSLGGSFIYGWAQQQQQHKAVKGDGRPCEEQSTQHGKQKV